MYCKNCGRQINDDAKFCPFCGATVTRKKKKKAIWIVLPIVSGVVLFAALFAALFLLLGMPGCQKGQDPSSERSEEEDDWDDEREDTRDEDGEDSKDDSEDEEDSKDDGGDDQDSKDDEEDPDKDKEKDSSKETPEDEPGDDDSEPADPESFTVTPVIRRIFGCAVGDSIAQLEENIANNGSFFTEKLPNNEINYYIYTEDGDALLLQVVSNTESGEAVLEEWSLKEEVPSPAPDFDLLKAENLLRYTERSNEEKQIDSWKDLYLQKLKLDYWDRYNVASDIRREYAVCFLDHDDIPELMVRDTDSSGTPYIYLYTVKNDNVVTIPYGWSAITSIRYKEKENIIEAESRGANTVYLSKIYRQELMSYTSRSTSQSGSYTMDGQRYNSYNELMSVWVKRCNDDRMLVPDFGSAGRAALTAVQAVGSRRSVEERLMMRTLADQADYLYLDIKAGTVKAYYMIPDAIKSIYTFVDISGNAVCTIPYNNSQAIINNAMTHLSTSTLPYSGERMLIVWDSPYGLCAYDRIPSDYAADINSLNYLINMDEIMTKLYSYGYSSDIMMPDSSRIN